MALAENQITLEIVEDGNAIYTEEPASPYESGDLYVKTEEVTNGLVTDADDVLIDSDSNEFEVVERGEANVYVCKNDRPSGVFNPDDWQLAATDNTQLNQLKEHFWYDDAGAHVQGETTGFRNDLTSTGMNIVDTSTETSVAQFGSSGARVGQTGISYITLDADSFQFNNGSSVLAHIGYDDANDEPYFTFGDRYNNSTIGNLSFAEGTGTTASGYASHAEGEDTSAEGYADHAEGKETTANGDYSHAEGRGSTASGASSHAEGDYCVASGDFSHAQNNATIASSDYQTALGTYNEEDNQDTYAVIIGNGTADNARSNALTVDWNGVIDTENGTVPVFPLFKKVSVNHNVTVAANSYATEDFAPAAQAGYTRVGIVGWNTASTHVFIATCTGTTITFCNKSSSSQTCNNAQIDWLFIRSSI